MALTNAVSYHPESSVEARTIIQDNINNTVTIMFYDPTTVDKTLTEVIQQQNQEQKEEKGFWGSLVTGIRGMFNDKEKSISEFAGEIEDKSVLVEIDTSNPDFEQLQRSYNVNTVPYLIILSRQILVYRGVPSTEANEKLNAFLTAQNVKKNNEDSDEDDDLSAPILIEPGKTEFLSTSKDDPFYFGDNTPVYAEEYYKDAMNGGMIEKSDRLNIQQNVKPSLSEYRPKIETVANPEERFANNKNIKYYEDRMANEPPPKRIEIQGPVHSITDKAFSQPVDLKPDNVTETHVIEEKVVIVEAPPKVEIPKPVETQRTVEVIRKCSVEEEVPEPPPKPQEKQVVVIEKCPAAPPAPVPVPEPVPVPPPAPKIVEVVRPPPVVAPPVPKVLKTIPGHFDDKWERVLNDEKGMAQQISKLNEVDSDLARTFQTSEAEIHESEEMFYKAKNAIEKSLAESERQMTIYEQKLDELYTARQEAIRARDNLYHPCNNCAPTKDGFVEQQLKAPYKVVKRQSLPSDQSNFHDLYEAAMHNKSKNEK